MEDTNLMLGRRVGESITIDDHTLITVIAVEGERVKFGITGSEKVWRGEIRDKVSSPSLDLPQPKSE